MARSKVPVYLPGSPVQSDEATPKGYVDLRSVPAGGAVGQALIKVTAADYDYAWADQSGSGGGGGGGPHGHPESEITNLVADLAALDVRLDTLEAEPDPVLDHGGLTGLADDDHPQYFNQTRGDARYVLDSDGRLTDPRDPNEHGSTHDVGGSDDLSGYYVPWINVGAPGGVPAYNDLRFSDARTPVAHNHPMADITGLGVALDGKAALGAPAAAVSAHEAASDPHPGYLTPAEGNAAYAALNHNHSGVYDPAGTATAAVAAHTALGDPHPGYLTPAEGNAAYDALGAAAAARTAHEAASDPHPGYLTQTEGDGRYSLIHSHDYEPAGAISAHTAEPDPHEQYTTQAEVAAEFAALGHGHDLSDYVRRTGTQTLANAFVFNGAVSVPQGTVAAHAARRDDTRFVLAGGTGGQVLTKGSNTDHDLTWTTPVSPSHNHNSAYDATGTAAAAVSAHEAASDPHPGYLTAAEGNAAYAALSHNHNASAINAGTLAYARLPVGTTANTVAAGDDTRMTNARTPTAHNHAASEINSGVLALARIPTGTTGTTVALGDHTHAGGGGSGGGGFAAGLVPATSTTPTVTHGLGTRDLIVSVREVSTDLIVRVATETIGDNDLRFTFTTQPTAGQYRYTILSAAATLGTGAHSHAIAEVTGLGDSLGGKAASSHTHVIADTTSLQDALDGKAATGHNHDASYLTPAQGDAAYAALAHTHTLASLGAAAAVHAHAAADVSSGTFAFARIPTGSTGSTVAIGNHTHGQYLSGLVPFAPVALTDAATIATDASASNHFRCTVTADRALGIPTNPTDGQRALWEFTASAAQRVITIPTGSTDSFETTVVAPTPSATIPSGKTGFVGAIYSFARRRWTMLGVTVTT